MKTEQIIFPSHIIYLTEGSKRKGERGEKTGKILACPPIFHLLCAHPSSVHLLIWSCHRLGKRDLQPLETNDLAGEGQQLMAGGATILGCWDLLCVTEVGMKHLGIIACSKTKKICEKTQMSIKLFVIIYAVYANLMYEV